MSINKNTPAVYLRIAQGPQIYSTPSRYIDLTSVPFQNPHFEVYDNRRKVLFLDPLTLLPSFDKKEQSRFQSYDIVNM